MDAKQIKLTQRNLKRAEIYPVLVDSLRQITVSFRLSLLGMDKECAKLGMEIVDEMDTIIEKAKELL